MKRLSRWSLLALGIVGTTLCAGAPKTAVAAEDRLATARAGFARALAEIQPGMAADAVRAKLGAPGDIRTASDPGGIAAARTVAVWRYGTDGHLSFGTLGTVHIQADGKVQYVFGGRGTPPPERLFPEAQLRKLLRLLDAVPSYNGPGDPLALVQAVNALQRLGRERALAAVAEYLRVSSSLDDAGREGTFLVLRALFEVPDPPGHLPAMIVGAPSPPAPADVKTAPRHPLAIVDDIPLLLVFGHSLAGKAQPPEDHLAWFRQHGVLRARPLTPPTAPLPAMQRIAGTSRTAFLTAHGLADASGRRLILEQLLRLLRVPLAANTAEDEIWRQLQTALSAHPVRWDTAADRYAR